MKSDYLEHYTLDEGALQHLLGGVATSRKGGEETQLLISSPQWFINDINNYIKSYHMKTEARTPSGDNADKKPSLSSSVLKNINNSIQNLKSAIGPGGDIVAAKAAVSSIASMLAGYKLDHAFSEVIKNLENAIQKAEKAELARATNIAREQQEMKDREAREDAIRAATELEMQAKGEELKLIAEEFHAVKEKALERAKKSNALLREAIMKDPIDPKLEALLTDDRSSPHVSKEDWEKKDREDRERGEEARRLQDLLEASGAKLAEIEKVAKEQVEREHRSLQEIHAHPTLTDEEKGAHTQRHHANLQNLHTNLREHRDRHEGVKSGTHEVMRARREAWKDLPPEKMHVMKKRIKEHYGEWEKRYRENPDQPHVREIHEAIKACGLEKELGLDLSHISFPPHKAHATPRGLDVQQIDHETTASSAINNRNNLNISQVGRNAGDNNPNTISQNSIQSAHPAEALQRVQANSELPKTPPIMPSSTPSQQGPISIKDKLRQAKNAEHKR